MAEMPPRRPHHNFARALISDMYYWYISPGGQFMQTAKVFWSGRSQAIRLPKDFRFAGDTVRIRRHGNAVILEPVPQDWGWLEAIIGTVDEDFARAASEQPQDQDRRALDFFK